MQLNWLHYLNKVFSLSGVDVTENMTVTLPSTPLLYGVLDLFRKTDPRILKNLIATRLFTYMAPDGDYEMREAFDTYYSEQNYAVYPRDQYCLRKILGYPDNTHLSFALTYQYQLYYYNINKLQKVIIVIIAFIK